jgi:hypothetical protein
VAAPGESRAEQVVISEIMYHPPGDLPEYIEIANVTATPLDLAEWRLRGGVTYDFPKFAAGDAARYFLKPFERVLLSPVSESMLRAAYPIPASVRVFGAWTGSLDNAGERITLQDKNGVVLCTVTYNDRGTWPIAADGAGHSLVLKNPDRKIDDWRNWTSSQRRLGTPGTEQAVQAETPIASPEVNLSVGVPFVNYGDAWRYHDQNVDLGTAWRASAYDDSGWPEGSGLFGYETAPLPPPGIRTAFSNAGQLTYYLRKKFVYNGSLSGLFATLDQIIDDGAVYYLNGVEFARSGMPGTAITFATAAARTVTDAIEEPAILSGPLPSLVAGTNVLAVEVHQPNNTSSDLVFGARLSIALPSAPSLVINEVLPGSTGAGFIEIHNPGASAVNLRNHYVTDDPANLTKFRITSDVVISAGGLGTIGFVESGLPLTSPVRVYLVTTNGASIINAINANMALDGRSIGRKPVGAASWFTFAEATRGAANQSQGALAATLHLNEVHFTPSNTVDWIEVHNAGDSAISLEGLSLATRADLTDRVALSGTVPARGLNSINVNLPVSGSEASFFLIGSGDTVVLAQLLARPAAGGSQQAYPDGSNEWYLSALPSRNATNNPARETAIVINEVMYDAPSDEPSAEFIELYNRGAAAVDVSGWRLSDAVSLTIPAGTTMDPDTYLVLAADAAYLRDAYGPLLVVGDWTGRLGNNGDRIRLLDATGNLADEIDYRAGGNWPNLAHGDGASMELRHPALDNSLGSAWTDSDETNKASFATYRYADQFRQLTTTGSPTDYKELHFHLVGDSHVVLRNVQLRLGGSGANLLVNTDKMSTNGASATGWLAQGTHFASRVVGTDLHLISDGHGDNRANRVEIDAQALTPSSSYEISFEARWVSGASRLIAQTWDHSIGTSISLPVPKNLGTPGLRNSKFVPLPPPQVDNLLHSPPVPSPGAVVRVTARITSPTVAPQVQLFHRLDNNTGGGVWANKPMSDNGQAGDQVAGDGIYTAQLSEYGVNGQVVQFYVVATGNGQASQQPKWGASKPALYVVDTPTAASDLRRMRFVVSALDIADLSGGNNPTPPNGYAFPRLANHYYNATAIIHEQDVVYNCEIRNSGSPWTRGGDLSRGKYKFPRDQLFRNKEKYSYDNDPAGGSRHHNRIARYWLYLFGHPANENEYVNVEINAGGTALREEVDPLGNDLLDRIYGDGSQGELYRIDDEWWFSDDWSQQPSRNADWSYKGVDNGTRYHTEWMKRTRENEYDYSSLANLFKTISQGTYTQAQIERLMDPLAVTKMAAIRGYMGDWDSFSLNRGKNGYFYRRSTDGRFMFFHWDSDLAFQSTTEVFYNGMTGFRPYLEKPYNFRLFKHYLAQLVENYTRNSPRLGAWLQAEEDASTQYTVSSAYTSWFTGREAGAFTLLGANRTAAFAITSNGGSPITTSANVVSLSGTAPLRAFRVEVVGHPEAVSVFTTENGWTVSNISLRTGANSLTVNIVDEFGNVIDTRPFVVTKTGNAPPVMVLEADPGSWQLAVTEVLTVDAARSADPDFLPLTFAWNVTPSDAQVDTSRGDKVLAVFPAPGLYRFEVTGTDGGGASTTLTREATVYAPDGFSSFGSTRLDPWWRRENAAIRANYQGGSYFSLNEISGSLVLQILDDRAYPLGTIAPAYPLLWRSLPALTDWSWGTKVGLRAQVFGDYMTGLLIETQESGAPVRYAFGIEDGTSLNVRRVAGVTSTTLRTTALAVAEPEIRIRRAGNALVFEQRTNDVWFAVHSASLASGVSATRAGLFLASDTAQRIKSAFDYAVLVDPSATSDLRQNLRLSEIMYNPVGGGDFEYVELANIGSAALDLTGVKFTAGIDYTFGPTILGPRQYLVVAKNPAAFASRYSTTGFLLAPGGFLGQLNNAGETIELSDSNNVVILSVTYGDVDPWPIEADGAGSSLEARTYTGNLSDPLNWRPSPEANGSPGRAGGDALGTVIVNEALTHTDPPFEDAIELYNRTEQPINIGGWFLSDARTEFKKFRIPDNTVVPALGFKVFYEIEFNTNNPLVPFSLSSANGDQVYLSAADASGNLTGYRSAVSFDAAANGVSFGRYETSVGRDFPALLTRTLGQDEPADLVQFRTGTGLVNTAPRVGPIVINEIMYRPPDVGGTNDNVADEFIELHNLTTDPVALFDPAAPTNTWHLRGGADFDFPTNITLAPRAYALVVSFNPQTNATALATFRATYAVPAAVAIFGPYSGRLDNGGEDVRLNRADTPQPPVGTNAPAVPRILVDRVAYADAAPWPEAADGTGQSLQRRRPHEYGNDPVNWKSLSPTPGRANVSGAGFEDTDADGLPDNYESANAFDPNQGADASQDADADGRTNYQEFLDGTNPRNAAERLTAPSITTPPQPLTIAAGSSAGFTVAVAGSGPFSYQWRFNGAALLGATNQTFNLGSAKASDRGEYSVVVANAAGFTISAGAALQVNEPLSILVQPLSRVTDRGGTVSFNVFATGTGTLLYQWQFNGEDLPGATSATLLLSNVQPEAGGNYAVVIRDSSTTMTSAAATLSVLSPPFIVTQPQSKTAVAYNDTFFSVTAGGEGPFAYQWRFNGAPIQDATNSILALPNLQPNQAGLYSVIVFNPVSSVTSSNALLTLLIPATITQQPRSTNVTIGGTATFVVSATSSTPIRYQWRFNDTDIPNATNNILTVVNVQEETTGIYHVILTDAVGTVRSEAAVLGVIIPLTLVQGPLSQSVPEGGSVTFSGEVRGNPLPFGFEWRKGSFPVVSNTIFGTKSFFTISNVTLADAAGYRMVARNVATPGGVANTTLAALTVLSDFDRDGLPDALEESLGLNTNNVADALSDLDGDGVSNRDEYRAGTDLQDPASFLRLNQPEIIGSLATIVLAASSNKTYTVEYSDDLRPGLWLKLDDLVARATNHIRVINDPNPSANRFYRVVTPRRP